MTTSSPAAPEQQFDGDKYGFREIGVILFARWARIAIVTFLIGGVCATYALLATPIYRATAVLAPASSDRGQGALGGALGQLGGIASLAGINVDARDATTEEAFAILRSREFLERFIADHQLLPRLFSRRWNSRERRWNGAPEHQPTPAKGVKYLNDNVLAASKDKKTGLLAVTADWEDRIEAASWANELVSRVNAEMRARAIASAEANRQYLEKELEGTQLVETREAINRLIEAQVKQGMIASVTQEYAFRTIGHALPPDADDRLWPKRFLLVIGGLIGGFLLACGGVLVSTRRSPKDRANGSRS